SKFHNAFEGGLCDHSMNVFRRLKSLCAVEADNQKNASNQALKNLGLVTPESIAICGLLHDICKVNFYVVEMRNKKEGNEWIKVPYFTIDEEVPYGHGEKSVYIISGFMRLTRDEAMAINWHMGGFDTRVKGGDYSLSSAFQKHPLAALTHIADMEATYFDEETGVQI
ncbi:MAG: hypothetical protein RR348_04580, partial [Clostridia bacterium]